MQAGAGPIAAEPRAGLSIVVTRFVLCVPRGRCFACSVARTVPEETRRRRDLRRRHHPGQTAMRAFFSLLRATLAGGILFLLPIGIVLVVFGKLLVIARAAGQVVHDRLFPGYESNALALALAVGVLVLIALLAGLFARTLLGRRMFVWLEAAVLARLPIYTILRQMLADMAGSSERLAGRADVRVVMVRLDDMTQLGFVVDELPGEGVIVYLPGAPSALSGTVALVAPERVSETDLTPEQVMASMRRLGAGIVARARK